MKSAKATRNVVRTKEVPKTPTLKTTPDLAKIPQNQPSFMKSTICQKSVDEATKITTEKKRTSQASVKSVEPVARGRAKTPSMSVGLSLVTKLDHPLFSQHKTDVTAPQIINKQPSP
jgi:hypothetical protein